MTGQHVQWYRLFNAPDGRWACYLRGSHGIRQSFRTSLALMEAMMRGDRNSPLWRKQDEAARRFIWC